MDTLYREIVMVMEKVQQTSSCHQKYCNILVKLFQKSNKKTFYKCFERILTYVINQDPKARNVYAERAIDFCASFCVAAELITDSEFGKYSPFKNIIHFLLDLHNLDNNTVRYRVCQMINKLLNNSIDIELNGDLCDEIEEAMLQRTQEDSKSEIRFQAISAIYRLQNPDDFKCKIISTMILSMSGDLTAKVRKLCVQKIGIRRDVLAALVVRTRDINSDVRLAAFTRASKLAKHFKISERHAIIKNGVFDTCEVVKSFVLNQLIPAWLSSYDNDYLRLLKAFRLDATEYQIEKTAEITKYILQALFRPVEEILGALHITENRLLAYEDLNWESAIYWQHLVKMFRKSEKFELYLYNILPDLIDFAKYIRMYCKQYSVSNQASMLEFQFVLNQLFLITQGFDLSDTVSRQGLNKLISQVLNDVDLHTNVATTVIQNLEKSIPTIEDRCNFICEIISNIMYPELDEENFQKNETMFKIAHLKVQLNCLNEQLMSTVREEDFESAARYKEEISQLKENLNELQNSLVTPSVASRKTDPAMMLKCFNIARGLLISTDLTTLNPALRTLCKDVIVDHLMRADLIDDVRTKALECFALCCIIDNKNAQKGIHIFATYLLTNGMSYNIEHLKISIKATVDLLVAHGHTVMNPQENKDFSLISLTDVVQVLVDLMDHENIEVQLCSTQGLCNLILSCRIQSGLLISRMILKWCNPTSDEEEAHGLRQVIGMMLEQLPKLPDAADQMERAVLPTIKTLLKAPNSSPLSEVNIQDIIKFLLTMCNVCEESSNLHSRLAISVCCEIKENPSHMFNVVLSKILLMLDLPTDDKQILVDLLTLCDELRDNVHNRTVLNNIIKFQSQLEAINSHDILVINEDVEE